MIFDIANAIANAATKLIELHRIDKWCRLIFTMLFSAVTSFLFVCGSALIAHRATVEGIGEGMVSAALMATILFRRSDLTKGMIVALPEEEAAKEIHTDTQVIQK